MKTQVALCDVRGLLNDLLEKLSSEDCEQWLDGLKKFLRKENSWVTAAVGDTITRIVSVNRTRSPQEMLNATGRKQYVNYDVVQTIPRGEGKKTEVVFLKPGRQMSDDELEKWFDERGFRLADPYSLAKVNQDDSVFADSHPNGTHWKDSDGEWCYAAFYRWSDDERDVRIGRRGPGWYAYWWFGGVRK